MPRIMIDGPRWLFLTCLLYAPWAYGCTTSGTILGLLLVLAIILSVWLAGSLTRGFWPRMHWLAGACIVALLLQGWWMALNPHYHYDPTSHNLLPTLAFSRKLPGTIDQHISFGFMLRISLLMGVVWFVADLVRRPLWVMRLCWTVGLSGASLILFGLIQKASGAQMIFWAPGRIDRALFFATYNYSGNAGAFINLVTPMVLGMTFASARGDQAYFRRALWVSALLISLVGALVNLSRVALLITALQIFIAILLFSRDTGDFTNSRHPQKTGLFATECGRCGHPGCRDRLG